MKRIASISNKLMNLHTDNLSLGNSLNIKSSISVRTIAISICNKMGEHYLEEYSPANLVLYSTTTSHQYDWILYLLLYFSVVAINERMKHYYQRFHSNANVFGIGNAIQFSRFFGYVLVFVFTKNVENAM